MDPKADNKKTIMYQKGNTTDIIFYCGKKINIPFSYGIIDNQILRATRLIYILEINFKQKRNR